MTARLIDLTAERDTRRPLQLRFRSEVDALTSLQELVDELLDEIDTQLVVPVDHVWRRLDEIRAIAQLCRVSRERAEAR